MIYSVCHTYIPCCYQSIVKLVFLTSTWSRPCSRVRNSSGDSLLRSCEFLEDVLFQDFPAELFLQRPALIKVCTEDCFVLSYSDSILFREKSVCDVKVAGIIRIVLTAPTGQERT